MDDLVLVLGFVEPHDQVLHLKLVQLFLLIINIISPTLTLDRFLSNIHFHQLL